MQNVIDISHDNWKIKQVENRHKILVKQLKETPDYDTKTAHVVLSRVEIDLDEGAKAN